MLMKKLIGWVLTVMVLWVMGTVAFASNDATTLVVKPPGIEQTIVSENLSVPEILFLNVPAAQPQGIICQYGNASPSMETAYMTREGSLAISVNPVNEGIWYPLKTYLKLASFTYNNTYKTINNSNHVIRGYTQLGYSIWS
jgi:hypothetical protein